MSLALSPASRARPARVAAFAVVGIALMVSACDNPQPVGPLEPGERLLRPQSAAAPANADERIQKFPLDFTFPLDCGGETITAHVEGFVQTRAFDRADSRNVELMVINIHVTFSNAAGETFVWREVGIDHFTVDQDGNLLRAVLGRAGVEFGTIGRVVVNLDTGEVEFVAGRDVGLTEENACAALT